MPDPQEPGHPDSTGSKDRPGVAGALASIVSALLYTAVTVLWVGAAGDDDLLLSWFAFPIAVQILVIALLGFGGYQMLMTAHSRRAWIIPGSSLALLLAVVGFVSAAIYRAWFISDYGETSGPAITGSATASTLIYMLPAAATLILALRPRAHRSPDGATRTTQAPPLT